MSTDIESRLRAALEARAELVTTEALAPQSLETSRRERPWWRSEGGMLFLAAVCVIVLAIPVLAMGLAREVPREGARPSDGPSTGSDATGSDATDDPISSSTPLTGDVDGDGEDDVVRLVSGGDLPDGVTEVQAELTLRGAQSWVPEPGQDLDLELARLADVNGVPGAEIFVDLGSGPAGLVVLTAGESQLGTVHRTDVALGVDETGLLHGWWVSGSRLRTSVSTEEVPAGTESYAVEAVEWRPGEGELLVAAPLGRWCVRASEPERLLDCDAVSADASESSSPSASASPSLTPTSSSGEPGVGPAEPYRWWEHLADVPQNYHGTTEWDGLREYADWTVDGDRAWIEGSTFHLLVDGREQTLELPWSGARMGMRFPLAVGGGSPTMLVYRPTEMEGVHAAGPAAVVSYEDGQLLLLTADVSGFQLGARYGSSFAEAPYFETGVPNVQGATTFGELFTWVYTDREGIAVPPRPAASQFDGDRLYPVSFYRWTRSGTHLEPQSVGEGCITAYHHFAVYECPPA